MKAGRIGVAMVIMLGLGLCELQAQAVIFKDRQWTLDTGYGIYKSEDNRGTFTPSINVVHQQGFIIDLDDPLVPEKGVKKQDFVTRFFVTGPDGKLYYCTFKAEGHVYSDGRVWIVFHYNGEDKNKPEK